MNQFPGFGQRYITGVYPRSRIVSCVNVGEGVGRLSASESFLSPSDCPVTSNVPGLSSKGSEASCSGFLQHPSGLPSHLPHFRWWLPRACVRAYVVVTLERCERTSMRDRVVTMKIRQATGTTSTKTTPRAPRPVIGHRQITSQQHPSPPR